MFSCQIIDFDKELLGDEDGASLTNRVEVIVDYETDNQLSLSGYKYSDLITRVPEGLRMQVYTEGATMQTTNLNPSGGTVLISEGTHSLLFYNNDTEYIVFDDIQSYATARATTRSRTRASYNGNSFKAGGRSENTVNPPDMLFGAYIESYTHKASYTPDTLRITMHPLVFNYVVVYQFSHGLNNVVVARGALAGMADAVYLNSGTTSPNEATLLYDCSIEKSADRCIAVVKSFGIPNYPKEAYSKSDRVYALNLEVRLSNGTYVTYEFDVTDQVAAQPLGGEIIVSGIEVDDALAAASGGGFVPSVSGWDDYDVISVPLR
jgi:hypothetical protein